MNKETRVRYIGPERSGVPSGRMGNLLESDDTGISMVSWDPYSNCDCQVTHSGCSTEHLEVVTSLPRCKRPTRAGTYVIEYHGSKDLAFVREDGQELYVRWNISGTRMEKIGKDALWWGPIEVK